MVASLNKMGSEEISGWVAADCPNDGNASEGELDCQKLVSKQNKKKKASGGFQSMGLSMPVLKGVLRKGYNIPTPIQRKTIPTILDGKDVVAMARTGSGKTAAFLIPMFEKLKVHSIKQGARALIISPTRELAMQTLNFAKAIGKFTNLRAALILGGESIESQFAVLQQNPDIIIATPKRFKHIAIEMNLKLTTIEYVVFDEVDRLFEMKFSEQLDYIMQNLNPERQTLLFSATLPKVLLDFAQIGLSEPVLVRLDVETKISDNLEMSFFKVNNEDKLPLLLHLLRSVIDSKKQTVLFVPTRHHVEFFQQLFQKINIDSTYIFSSLDASARKINMAKFRLRRTHLLIVTDVAARGLDVPLLDNVINYNFPAKAKLFVHRVGRVARANRSGVAYSFVSPDESVYLLELHMFLSQSLKLAPFPLPDHKIDVDRMYGKAPQDIIDESADFLQKTLENTFDLKTLQKSAENSLAKYVKSRPPAAQESIRRLREEMWESNIGFHPMLCTFNKNRQQEIKRLTLLDKLKNIRHKQTIFEIKKEGKNKNDISTAFIVEKRKFDKEKIENYYNRVNERKEAREKKLKADELAEKQRKALKKSSEIDIIKTFKTIVGKPSKRSRLHEEEEEEDNNVIVEMEDSTKVEMEESKKNSFIPYHPQDRYTEQGYALYTQFEKETKNVAFDFIADEDKHLTGGHKDHITQWDRKQKKYVNINTPVKILTESGAYVVPSYKKDLYKKWQLKTNVKDKKEDEEPEESANKLKKELKKGNGFVDLSNRSKMKLPQAPKIPKGTAQKPGIYSSNLKNFDQIAKDARIKKKNLRKTLELKNRTGKKESLRHKKRNKRNAKKHGLH